MPSPTVTSSTPGDLQDTRSQQIGLLNYLLGMGPDPRATTPDQSAQAFQTGLQQALAGGQDSFAQFMQQHPNGPQGYPVPGTTAGTPLPAAAGGGAQTPQQRLESFFGPLGITPSGLQTQSSNALGQYLNQMSPEQRASQVALPQLQQNLSGNGSTQGAINGLMGLQSGAGGDVEGRLAQIGQRPATGAASLDSVLQSLGMGGQQAAGSDTLSRLASGQGTSNLAGTDALSRLASGTAQQGLGGGPINIGGPVVANTGNAASGILSQLASSNPGQGVIDALQPAFQRNLAAANQVGGRFGSGNELQRGQAVDNFNQTAQQALQQGVTQQTNAAGLLGQLSQAGNELGAQTALGSRGQDVQAAIAQAQNQLQGGTSGLSTQLQAALGLSGNQLAGLTPQLQAALGLGSQQQAGVQNQLQAIGQNTSATQGLDASTLQALQALGGLRLQGQQQAGTNLNNAGSLGVQQGQLGNQAAQTLGTLGANEGSSDLQRLLGAFGAGATETGQQNQGQQTALQILLQQLGGAQSATIGGPAVVTPSPLTQLLSFLGGAAKTGASAGAA